MSTENSLPPGVPPAGNPPVVPVVAPQPTPAPVVPAPAPAPVVPADPKPAPVAVETAAPADTGNAVLDAAINVMVTSTGATQADIDRLVGKAMEHGNADLVDEAFAREKFGDKAESIIKLAQAAVQENQASMQRSVQQVYAVAGSKENWDNAVSVFNTNAPDYIREAAKMLLDSGKLNEGAKLIMDTVQNAGLIPTQNPTIGSGGAVVPATSGALSAQAFATEMAALKKEAGNRSLESGPFADKYQRLIQRRTQGRQMGL